MDAAQTYDLRSLAEFIGRVFALNLPQAVWITAEIGQANISRGNCWLTLVQKNEEDNTIIAQIDGVVWQRQLSAIHRQHGVKLVTDLLQNGMSVRLQVTASFHTRYGLKLVVEDVDPNHTLGELERRRQETLQRLSADGSLERNASRDLSDTPQNLAIVSSETAAGLADFREQLNKNPYGYQFRQQLFPAQMQGAATGPAIIARLKQICNWPTSFDAVVIIRGGGGRTDLSAFDDEVLARTIADYPLPVIAGIGHETDDVVIDHVAHTSLKTPTATAVFLVNRLAATEARLLAAAREIYRTADAAMHHAGPRLDALQQQISQSGKLAILTETARIDRSALAVKYSAKQAVLLERNRLKSLETLLDALRPETTMRRGYAFVSQADALITDASQLEKGAVEVRFRNSRASLVKE